MQFSSLYSRLYLNLNRPGKFDPDNKPHVGGNQWAGGTGGRDTAGLGGRGLPPSLHLFSLLWIK